MPARSYARHFTTRSRTGINKCSTKKNSTDINTTNIIDPILPRTRSKGVTRDFNKNVHFLLVIDTDKPRVAMGPLLNRFESQDAKIVNIGHTTVEKWDDAQDDMIPLTQEELDVPAFIGSEISFSSVWLDRQGKKVAESHMSFCNHKGYFTIQEMVDMVVELEEVDRPKTSWFGGIDAHHIYFEGLCKQKDGSYLIRWGS
jgi:hypothetical protein